jgi:Tfp pilus assembly protein PilO
MDQLKKWVTLSVVASLLILAAGWFLAVSPKRTEAADLRTQAAEQVGTNSTLETQLQVLKAQAKDLPKEQAKLARSPPRSRADPALPSLVRALLDAAASSGVELVSVAPAAPVVVAAPPRRWSRRPARGQATPDPAARSTRPPPCDRPAGQLAEIALAVNVVGDYFEVQQFMAALEALPRALRVTDLAVTPGASPTQQGEVSTEDGRSLSRPDLRLVFMAVDRPTDRRHRSGRRAPDAPASRRPTATTAE